MLLLKEKGRNQILIGLAAILLIAAGYLNYSGKEKNTIETSKLMDAQEMASIGDATFVSSSKVEGNEEKMERENQENIEQKSQNQNEQTVLTNGEETKSEKNEYFTKSRLERDKMYAASLESYQKMIESQQVTEEQKNIAGEEMKRLNQEKNAVMIVENLIQTKGFQEVIIFVNVDSVSVVVKAENLTDEQVAQIQNIVSRELKAQVEDIHISTK